MNPPISIDDWTSWEMTALRCCLGGFALMAALANTMEAIAEPLAPKPRPRDNKVSDRPS